jgi:hypothetical protein
MAAYPSSSSSFHRDYARALAEALREAEESPPSRSTEELLQETYQQLCHDCPIHLSSTALLQLSRVLEQGQDNDNDNNNKYILSNRFVNGLLQSLDRIERATTTLEGDTKRSDGANNCTTTNTTQDEEEAPSQSQSQHEPFVSVPNHDTNTDSALAVLAWTVFGSIPLKILQAKTLEEAAKLLGSFRGDVVVIFDVEQDRAATQQDEQANIETADQATESPLNHIPNDQEEEDDEVWATESDPSDYEFESDRFQQQLEVDAWAAALDEPSFERVDSWSAVAQAVVNLLSLCTYTKLSSLSMQQWKRLQVSEHLTQLALLLLLQDSQSASSLFESLPSHYWQQTLALYPIHFFRDATLQHTRDLLDDYLQFLSTLLQAPSSSSSSTIVGGTSPCTLLGLSLWSAVCSHVLQLPPSDKNIAKYIQQLRQSILEQSDDLTMILEQQQQQVQDETDETTATRNAIMWTFVPIWNVLSGIVSNSRAKSAFVLLTQKQAQVLLNSGMLRQWLVLWSQLSTAANNNNNNNNHPELLAVQQTLFDLSCASPKLLGKYTWRFANLAGTVCQLPEEEDDELVSTQALVDATLWNLIAQDIMLEDETMVQPTIVWKSKTTTAASSSLPPPTRVSCQATAHKGLHLLCERVVETLSDWKRRRCQSLPASLKFSHQQETLECFLDLVDRLVNNVLLSPVLSKAQLCMIECFLQATTTTTTQQDNNHDAKVIITSSPPPLLLLEPIQSVLQHWPSSQISSFHDNVLLPKVKNEDEEHDEDTNNNSMNDANNSNNHTILADTDETKHARSIRLQDQSVNALVNRLRKSVKTLCNSCLDQIQTTTSTDESLTTRSSKVD